MSQWSVNCHLINEMSSVGDDEIQDGRLLSHAVSVASEVVAQAFAEKFGTESFSSFTAFEDASNKYMKENYVIFRRSSSNRSINAVLRYEWVYYKCSRLSKFLYDRLPVNERLTEDELGTCKAFLKYGTPSCEVRQFVADEFGEILTTQDIYNYRRRYKLYTFLITDGMGIGRPDMYAFVEGEQFAPMRRLFGLFKEMMGEQYLVRTFVMDKLAAKQRLDNANANGRLKDRVHHADTQEHAIQKVSRHAEWFMREFEMHTSHHCDRRQILEGEGYVLNVLASQSTNNGCRIRTYRNRVYLTLVSKPPPTACDAPRKQMNQLMDKLYGLEPRKATAGFKQLIAHGQILLRQGSNSATGSPPSVVEDTAPQTRWRSRDTDWSFCVLCDRPTTTSDRWCTTDRVSYHADCYDGEPCPLCGDALQTCPKVESTE
ncbi:hypothetical protein CLF_109281 [Clonorchis sinensis]|uniref:ZSWIM1/3 RNaseH-like domain-containing protein n=1 Tax=Clonorchis sinensis TaxID=79923 RepID=G7YJ56_CLOSI|nr:hypothetical protein CLF_109281 [Clonorchis sinensis]